MVACYFAVWNYYLFLCLQCNFLFYITKVLIFINGFIVGVNIFWHPFSSYIKSLQPTLFGFRRIQSFEIKQAMKTICTTRCQDFAFSLCSGQTFLGRVKRCFILGAGADSGLYPCEWMSTIRYTDSPSSCLSSGGGCDVSKNAFVLVFFFFFKPQSQNTDV